MNRSVLKCMHQSGCRAPFPETELRRVLDKNTYEGLSKLRTEIELREANIHVEKIAKCRQT